MTTAVLPAKKSRRSIREEAQAIPAEAVEQAPQGGPPYGKAVEAFRKIEEAKREFAKSFVERDAELNLLLVGMIAKENVLLVGPPGTAKSMLCEAIHKLVGGESFGALMNKFTAPEELFGPPDLKKLEQGDYVRRVDGYLPTAATAFLDEIFKAGPGILNVLLKILNERTFKNGRQVVACPLEFALAASNEFPSGDNAGELAALFDRFLIRKVVKPVHTTQGRDRLMFGDLTAGPVETLTPEELAAARDEAASLTFSPEAKDALVKMLRELSQAGIHPGDRRCRKAVGVVKAWAWLEAKTQVEPEQLEILQHVLWDEPSEQMKKAGEIVLKTCNPGGAEVAEKILAAEAIVAKTKMDDCGALVQAARELQAVIKDCQKIKGDKATEAVRRIQGELAKIQKAAVEATN